MTKAGDSNTSRPTLILLNGRVRTGCARPAEAQAVAVGGDTILAVGNNRSIRRLACGSTEVVDLGGARVLAGFADAHVHVAGGGFLLEQVNLRDAAGEAEFGRRLREHAASLAPGRWVLGGNWDENLSLGGRLPDRALLDRFVPDRPALLRRYDGHIAAANSAALKLAGVDERTPNAPMGSIDREASSGRPTGILREAAMRLVADKVPPPDDAQIARAVVSALRLAARLGLTSVDDMGGGRVEIVWRTIEAYRRLAGEGALPVRVNVFLPLELVGQERAGQAIAGLDGRMLRFGGFKAFYDGSLGARTALMFEPYLDVPDTAGICMWQRQRLEHLVAQADAGGHCVAVHAIGDRAVSEVLDVFEAVIDRNGPRDRRLRIEHAQHVRPADVRRFGRLGVIASMQPYHALDDARFAGRCLGRRRMKDAFAWRSLLEGGAGLAFGSDWPVAPLSPLAGIQAAVNRNRIEGLEPPGRAGRQALTVRQAIAAYTIGSARAAGAGGGTIQPGEQADMVVIKPDILDPAEKRRLDQARVLMTVVAGRTAWRG